MTPRDLRSRDNPQLVRLRKLAQASVAYRKLGQVWVEGDHLCRAALARGVPVPLAIGTEAAWDDPDKQPLLSAAAEGIRLPMSLFAAFSVLGSPAGMGFVLDLPEPAALDPSAPSVVLDGVQDAGNVGSILRSAAALGASQVLALTGTAGLWSPKVLRAGMGAHFGLRLLEGLDGDALSGLQVPLLTTSSHRGRPLPQADLPWPCAWAFGHEGQGVSAAVAGRAALAVAIPQPGGEESLNVAAAAAICLYESARRRGA